MQQITLRLDEDTLESLEGEADENGVSRSEHIREVIDSRHEADDLRSEHEEEVERMRREHAEEVRALRDRIEELETDVERLENEKQLILEQREENTELVEYVEHERSLQERRERRQSAPAWKRAKWWLLGAPDPENGGSVEA